MSYAEFRARARKSLSGKWVSMVFILFVYILINGLFSTTAIVGVLLLLMGIADNKGYLSGLENWTKGMDKESLKRLEDVYGKDFEEVIYRMVSSVAKTMGELIPVLIIIIVIAIILYAVVGSMTTAGLYKQYYKLVSEEEISVAGLFQSIRLWPKMLGITISRYAMVYILLAIWSVSFIFGKMVAITTVPVILILGWFLYYLFIMAPFVLIDEEELSVIDCMKKSLNIAKGHTSRLFCLNISFIGWAIVVNLVTYILGTTIPIISTVAQSALNVYIYISYLHYYMYLTGQDRYLFMEARPNVGITPGFVDDLDLNMNQGNNQGSSFDIDKEIKLESEEPKGDELDLE